MTRTFHDSRTRKKRLIRLALATESTTVCKVPTGIYKKKMEFPSNYEMEGEIESDSDLSLGVITWKG